MNLPKKPFESGKPKADKGRARVGLIIALAVVLAGFIVMGYLILERMSNIEDRISGLDTRVGQMAGPLEEALEVAVDAAVSAEEAMTRAIAAEENAQQAARTRDVAEQARLNAESERAQAEEQAAAATAEAAAARREAERVEQERRAEMDRLEQALGQIVETRRTALGLVMNLGTDAIEFAFDSAELGFDERELLSRIAGVLLTSTGYSVYVYGHTDDVGHEQYNQLLSERRAQSVRDYLIESGIRADIITTRGYGQSSPRVAGDHDAARARNRRVEVGIVDVTLDYLGEAPNP